MVDVVTIEIAVTSHVGNVVPTETVLKETVVSGAEEVDCLNK